MTWGMGRREDMLVPFPSLGLSLPKGNKGQVECLRAHTLHLSVSTSSVRM